ncbi:MAG: class I SAM-dependent RNA methyltransferase [Clostridia bacterium]|nr:class I SAM-dependent RNA methyltransferase [Clostridia bacterium]
MGDAYKLIAPTVFGIESIAAEEFKRMGFENIRVQDGKVHLQGDGNMLARANICTRFAERILINVGEFTALTFTELFDNVKSLPWERYISRDNAFPVTGTSVNSALFSISDCQSIIKKAIADRLSSKYGISWLPETGAECRVKFSLLKDKVTLAIDTSGDGLHKRGYRRQANEAPLKETIAAAMCDMAHIYPDTHIYDPFCGSGTILIEAALMATKRAPGLNRYFAAERFDFLDKNIWREERTRAQDSILHNIDFCAQGFDIDESCVELTLHNAKKAGVEKYVKAAVADIKDFKTPDERLIVVTNPPYGERLLGLKDAEDLYKTMGERFIMSAGKKYFIISPSDDFERIFGKEADKRRKIYNGMIKCSVFMYFKNGKVQEK